MVKRPTRQVKSVDCVSDQEEERLKKKPRRKASEDVTWVPDSPENPSIDSSDDEKHEQIKIVIPAMKLTKLEMKYFKCLPYEKQIELNLKIKSIKDYSLIESECPIRLRVISLPLSDFMKTNILKKIASLNDENGESNKIRNWIDSFLKIPFGKHIPLPVTIENGQLECSKFMKQSKKILNDSIYGMNNAKTQIMQILAQWVANPISVGNVIALHGPAGVGKTSIAKYGISKALKRPFQFFSLGGASDISNYVGHSYTYEGSMWGRIVDCLMQSGCMNPVLYFDELDKISGTPHGEEISSMLIHLTDRTQNSQFHDRYFAGIDLDLSQCLFVFSFNDINLVNPILRDRMQIIYCSGYSEIEKQKILKNYIWPSLIERLKFKETDVCLTPESCKLLVSDYSSKEEGVRNLIRSAETIITRLNMLRIADEETMKDYSFYVQVNFPLNLTETLI